MRKLLVYPFTLDTSPLARYLGTLDRYDEVIPVAEIGAGFSEGADIAHIDGGTPCSAGITYCFEDAVNFADAFLFTAEMRDMEIGLKYLALAKKSGKEIFVCGNLPERLGVGREGCQMLAYKEYSTEIKPQDILLKIPVPVVVVMGQGPQCNKFDIQLGLRNKFQEQDYRVSQVGTKRYSALFGFHTLPQFPEAPLWKKILLYNRYFREIVKEESPDVLIVGIPGGIMPINERNNELFGETAIAITQSLKPDISILSFFMNKMDRGFLHDVKNYCRYALGVSPEYFHLSNTRLVFEQDMRAIDFLITDSSQVFEGQEEADDKFFNVFSPESRNLAFEGIISQLQNNIETF